MAIYDILISNDTIVDNYEVNQLVGEFRVIDNTENVTGYTYSIDTDHEGRFELVDNKLNVLNGSLLDHETYVINVTVDNGFFDFTKEFQIVSKRKFEITSIVSQGSNTYQIRANQDFAPYGRSVVPDSIESVPQHSLEGRIPAVKNLFG